MIADLLENYKRMSPDSEWHILRSFMINDHEIAWMESSYATKHAGVVVGRSVQCECDFTEGVGWRLENDNHYTIDAGRNCLPRKAAVYLRHMELRVEYTERFGTFNASGLYGQIDKVVLDMIAKAQAGEMIEDGTGAAAYGGYFYLQSVAAVMDEYIGHLWDKLYSMMQAKQISIDGAVITSYTQPPPPKWQEWSRIIVNGWTGIAKLPTHRQMAQEWKYEILDENGKTAVVKPGDRLLHEPTFGPDVEDVDRAEASLAETIMRIQQMDKSGH